jgi:transketolase N-terminal domain/subunit
MSDFDDAVRTIQFLSVDGVEKANSGHPGTPMALAGITVDLFTRYLRYNPKDPAWPNRDRFVLSCGHASMLLYSALHLAGYELSLDDLKDKLVGVIVVALAVSFLAQIAIWDGKTNLLSYGLSIALVILALGAFSFFRRDKSEDKPESRNSVREAEDASPAPGSRET